MPSPAPSASRKCGRSIFRRTKSPRLKIYGARDASWPWSATALTTHLLLPAPTWESQWAREAHRRRSRPPILPDLDKIVVARDLAKRAYHTIQQNLLFGVGVVHLLGITA